MCNMRKRVLETIVSRVRCDLSKLDSKELALQYYFYQVTSRFEFNQSLPSFNEVTSKLNSISLGRFKPLDNKAFAELRTLWHYDHAGMILEQALNEGRY